MTSFLIVIWGRTTTMCASYLVAQWKCLHYMISLTDFECVLHLHAGMVIHKHVMASGGSSHNKSLFQFKIKMLCTYSITRHTAEFTSHITLWAVICFGVRVLSVSLQSHYISSSSLLCSFSVRYGGQKDSREGGSQTSCYTGLHLVTTIILWYGDEKRQSSSNISTDICLLSVEYDSEYAATLQVHNNNDSKTP